MLGRLSPHALAAGALGFFVYQPLFLFGLGVVGALSPIAAARIGAGHGRDPLRRATHQALIFAVVYSVIVWIALAGAVPFLLAIGEPADVAHDAGIYLQRIPMEPGAKPRVHRSPRRVFGARASSPGADRRTCGGGVQRPRQLCADLRQARHAGARDHRLRLRHHAVADAHVRASARRVADRSAHALVKALCAALASRRNGVRGALAAWSADRRDDRGRSRRVRRRDAGHGPVRRPGDRGAHDRAADRLARLHGSARPRPGGDGQGRPRLWRGRRPRDRRTRGGRRSASRPCSPSFPQPR